MFDILFLDNSSNKLFWVKGAVNIILENNAGSIDYFVRFEDEEENMFFESSLYSVKLVSF